MSALKKLRRSRLSRTTAERNDMAEMCPPAPNPVETVPSSVINRKGLYGLYQCALCGDRYERSQDLVEHVEGGYHSSSSRRNIYEEPAIQASKIVLGAEKCLTWNDPEAGMNRSAFDPDWKSELNMHRDSVIKKVDVEPLSSSNVLFMVDDGNAPKESFTTGEQQKSDDEECATFPVAALECPQSSESDDGKNKPYYKCLKCSDTFTSAVLLRNHRVVHALDCPKCGDTFLIKPSLDRHLRERHGKDEFEKSEFLLQPPGLVDQIPDITAKSKSVKPAPQTFASDVLIVPMPDGWFRCKMCPKVCQARSDMSKHVRRHTNERPYSCEVCGERFKHQSAIANHLRIHTGERPYECCYCGKKFSQPSNKRRHEALHRGEKPFNCSICNRSFSEKTTLQTHFLQHTGERPFVCDLCGKGHLTNSALKQHRNSRHRQHQEVESIISSSSSYDDESASSASIRLRTEN